MCLLEIPYSLKVEELGDVMSILLGDKIALP